MKFVDPQPGVELAKDPVQRVRQVVDMQKERDGKERARIARIHAAEEREMHEGVERAWNKQGEGFGCDFFGGIGEGRSGSKGTYVFRGGKLVPKDEIKSARTVVDHGRDLAFCGIGKKAEGFAGRYVFDKRTRAWVRA